MSPVLGGSTVALSPVTYLRSSLAFDLFVDVYMCFHVHVLMEVGRIRALDGLKDMLRALDD
eukprot:666098-Heterocapsa_arctica.AAC.1